VRPSTYRLVLAGLGLTLVLVAAAGLLLIPDGRSQALPAPLEAIEPGRDDTVGAGAQIRVNIAAGYTLTLYLDGVRIPEGETTWIPTTGELGWGPGEGKLLERFSPGNHRLRVAWERTRGVPDPGEFSWSFRSQ